MSGKDIERNRYAQNPRSSQKHIRNNEQRTRDLSRDRPANDLRHISDTMTSTVVVAEIALDYGGPSVQQAPAQNTERTAHGA